MAKIRPKKKNVFSIVCFSLLLLLLMSLFIKQKNIIPSISRIHGSEWLCKDPYIYLRVTDIGEIKGYILHNSEEVDISFGDSYGLALIYKSGPRGEPVRIQDFILEGYCVCTEQSVAITVKKDYYFDGQYQVIVLNRIS